MSLTSLASDFANTSTIEVKIESITNESSLFSSHGVMVIHSKSSQGEETIVTVNSELF